MSIDQVFQLLKYRASKAGYNGYISSNDFNLLFPQAEIRYYLKLIGNQNQYQYGNPIPPIAYPGTLKVSTSVSKFKSPPTTITIDGAGKYTKPNDYFFVDSLRTSTGAKIERVEEQDIAGRIKSYVQPPTIDFPIYIEYSTYIQFYPITLGTASITYLKSPTTSVWGYTLNGSIDTFGTITGGSSYVNGTYLNVPLTGGSGTGAQANITVAGGAVTIVTIVTNGFMYKQGDNLSASNALLGGAGTGFSVVIATIKNPREIYNSATSTDPEWSKFDIDEIIYLTLKDIGVNLNANELSGFAMQESKTGGI